MWTRLMAKGVHIVNSIYKYMASVKRIIIIGATSGIGYEITQLYRKQGWRIGIAGRRTELLEKSARKLLTRLKRHNWM